MPFITKEIVTKRVIKLETYEPENTEPFIEDTNLDTQETDNSNIDTLPIEKETSQDAEQITKTTELEESNNLETYEPTNNQPAIEEQDTISSQNSSDETVRADTDYNTCPNVDFITPQQDTNSPVEDILESDTEMEDEESDEDFDEDENIERVGVKVASEPHELQETGSIPSPAIEESSEDSEESETSETKQYLEYDIREFEEAEIAEINNYVITQVPQSKLPSLFMITEEPISKAEIFIIIHRILNAAKDFVEKVDTKIKLKALLEQSNNAYNEIYKLQLLLNNNVNLNNNRLKHKITNLVYENNDAINKLINSFLVFAEKQQLISTEKVTGIDLMKEEGKDVYNKLITKM